MKIRKKLSLGSLSLVATSVSIIAVISCSSVNGAIEFKVIGLNKDGTDYIIDVEVNKQFIAKIIEKHSNNIKNVSNLHNLIADKVLEKIKNMLPNSYSEGAFKNLKPQVLFQSETKFQVKVPIKSVVTNLPNFDQIKQNFDKKYIKSKTMKDVQKDYEDNLFIPKNLLKMFKKDKDDFFSKKYNDKKNGQVTKNNFINFNFLGIMSYAAGKLTDKILENDLNISTYKNVKDFLSKRFMDKKNKYQVEVEVILPNSFEIVEFQGKQATVYFYITNIQEEDKSKSTESKKVYKQKDASQVFKHGDIADVHYSLFVKKQLKDQRDSATIEVNDKLNDKKNPTIKIEETGVEQIFSGLKKGNQISRVVEVDSKKSGYEFNFKKNANGFTEKESKNAILSELFTKTEKKDDKENVIKNTNNEALYLVQQYDKYKAIMTFDIDAIKIKNKKNNWIDKTGENSEIVEKGDQVTYSNLRIEYLGLPFSGGESINYEGINGKLGFVFGFEKQMENMSIAKQKTITPIFPNDYDQKTLQSKLVKFIIKINNIKSRKTINLIFLKDNKLKNGYQKEITTTKEYDDSFKILFKNKIWEELIKNYLLKSNVKVPAALVQKNYSQIYIQTYVRNKGKIDERALSTIEKQALAQTEFFEIEMAFYKMNKIIGNEIIDKRKTLLNEIFEYIK